MRMSIIGYEIWIVYTLTPALPLPAGEGSKGRGILKRDFTATVCLVHTISS